MGRFGITDINDSCVVCLIDFKKKDKVRKTICNHFFHKDCLEKWLLKN